MSDREVLVVVLVSLPLVVLWVSAIVEVLRRRDLATGRRCTPKRRWPATTHPLTLGLEATGRIAARRNIIRQAEICFWRR